jgi:Fe-S cluster assembly ATP-binding protein
MKSKLIISNIHASIKEGKKILNGVDLEVKQGEVHVIMGPNGSGKSTFSQVIMGHPSYILNKGKILIDKKNITKLTPDLKSKEGLFLGFQYPVEIAGVNFGNFLRMAHNENSKNKKLTPIGFRNVVNENVKPLGFSGDIYKRSLNEGFSGGEKKKAEILQMTVLKPKFVILDEPDSGLDVDALKKIGQTLSNLDFPVGLIIITHYQRILRYIKPDVVHIMVNGKIIKSGDHELAKEIEENGYEAYANN